MFLPPAVTHELYLAKYAHCDADVIYFDYKKTFDSVVQVYMYIASYYKLWAYGISVVTYGVGLEFI